VEKHTKVLIICLTGLLSVVEVTLSDDALLVPYSWTSWTVYSWDYSYGAVPTSFMWGLLL